MNFDDWTVTVLAVALLIAIRPAVASLLQRYGAQSVQRQYNPGRAGGGAAMLFMAGYLISGPSHQVAEGYWHLASDALHDPFVRSLPIVWVPALCWLILTVLGFGWLFAGIRGYRGPRKPVTLIWALNEIAVCAALLLLRLYVPDDWANAPLINFALEGLYLSFLVGAGLRLVLVLLNPGGPSHPNGPGLEAPGGAFLGRLRRF